MDKQELNLLITDHGLNGPPSDQ